MTLDTAIAFTFGLLCGSGVAVWRTWAFARKLIHLGVSLDAWSEYDEATRQARGQSPRRDNVTALRRESER